MCFVQSTRLYTRYTYSLLVRRDVTHDICGLFDAANGRRQADTREVKLAWHALLQTTYFTADTAPFNSGQDHQLVVRHGAIETSSYRPLAPSSASSTALNSTVTRNHCRFMSNVTPDSRLDAFRLKDLRCLLLLNRTTTLVHATSKQTWSPSQ